MQNNYIIYYVAILFASLFAWLSQKFAKDKENCFKLNKFFWLLSILILVIMMGFRTSGVGVDDDSYQRIFNSVIKNGPIEEFIQTTREPGYIMLNYIIGIFTDDFQVLLFVTSFIPILLFYKAIEYERKNVNLFLVVFLFGTLMYLYFFGIIRLFIAVSIVAYALRYVFEKKNIKFVILVLLATTMHYSAIFMLFLLYFSTESEKKPRKMRNIILLVTVAMPVLIFVISSVIFPSMGGRYASYTQLDNFKLSIDQFDKLPIIIMAFILYNDLRKINKNIKIYIVLSSLTTVISIYSTVIGIGRMQWYLNFANCIILSEIVRAMNKNKTFMYWNIIFVPVLIVYGIAYSYLILNQASNVGMLNYSNVLFR